jgi:type VI secretion system protein ImpM
MAERALLAPGFYGKVPALGDFVQRRLPPGFLAVWDAWLQNLVQASRAELGAAWLDAWLQAPIWHFQLGVGLAGPAPGFGVLIPSVDRVGRYFPFSILGLSAAGGTDLTVWRARVEALALASLEDGFTAAALETELGTLGVPAAAEDGVPEGGSRWWARGAEMPAPGGRSCPGLPPPAWAGFLVTGRIAEGLD